MKNFLLKISRSLAAKKKIISLFFALLTVSLVNAKVAFLVPAGNTDETSMQYEDVDGHEQSPERRAWRWFRDNYVNPGNGQFICFNDLNNNLSDINAIWIYVDRINFPKEGNNSFDALFTTEIKANLQAYLNAGGNLFLCKQATRLEKDLVGAKKSDNSVLEPTYNCGGYITDYNREDKWGMSVHFYDTDGWGSYLSHAMFALIPNDHKGNDKHIEMIWSEPLEHVVTNNNCLFEHSHMEMNDTGDAAGLANFQSRNNCRVLGGWSNGDGCHCGGLIEFYPTETRKGTVIMMGLAAYQWINNNNGWGIENIQYMTKGALDYLNARPKSNGENPIPMEEKLAEDFFFPSHTTTFRTLHPDCEGLSAAYTLTSNPDGIARIEGNQLQFKAAGTVNLHIVLTESRGNKEWENGEYEYDREITFEYANPNAAQEAVEADLEADGIIEEEGVLKAMVLHASLRGLDSLSYTISNHYDGTEGEAYKGKTDDGFTRLYFAKSGKVLLTARYVENDWVEAWPVGEKEFNRVVEFHYAQETGPAFTWPSEFETGAVGPNSVITLPETAGGLNVTYTVEGNGSIEGNVLTLANVTSGTVTVRASVTENDVKVTWPKGTYVSENTLSFHAAEVGYLLPAAESIEHMAGWYDGEQPEYNAAKWFEDTYIATGKGRFVTVEELPTLMAKGIKALWVNIERIDITPEEGMFTAMPEPLKTYIQAGGNVLLTKQATRLAYLMDRIGYAPEFNAGGYTEENRGSIRSIATKMGTKEGVDEALDMSGHRLYEGMLSWDPSKDVYLVAENCKKTYNYCSWQDFFTDDAGTQHAYTNAFIQRMRDFESAWNATVFGVQGGIGDYCLSNIVEFNAKDGWAGRILAIGSAAYQWGSSNNLDELDNMKRLTSNALAYLNNEEPEAEVYTRSVTNGNYGTICLPMASAAIEGATMYRIADKTATGITIEEVAAMEAGTPYIFQASADEIRVTMTGQSRAVQQANGLVGNLGATITVPQGDNYLVLGPANMLYRVNSAVTIATNRAYINLDAVNPVAQAPGMRRRVIAMENIATGNLTPTLSQGEEGKVLRDGQLFIIRDGKTYNAQGQIVK